MSKFCAVLQMHFNVPEFACLRLWVITFQRWSIVKIAEQHAILAASSISVTFTSSATLDGLHYIGNFEAFCVVFSFLLFCQVRLFGCDPGMAQLTKSLFTAVHSLGEPAKFSFQSVLLFLAIAGSLPFWRHIFLRHLPTLI